MRMIHQDMQRFSFAAGLLAWGVTGLFGFLPARAGLPDTSTPLIIDIDSESGSPGSAHCPDPALQVLTPQAENLVKQFDLNTPIDVKDINIATLIGHYQEPNALGSPNPNEPNSNEVNANRAQWKLTLGQMIYLGTQTDHIDDYTKARAITDVSTLVASLAREQSAHSTGQELEFDPVTGRLTDASKNRMIENAVDRMYDYKPDEYSLERVILNRFYLDREKRQEEIEKTEPRVNRYQEMSGKSFVKHLGSRIGQLLLNQLLHPGDHQKSEADLLQEKRSEAKPEMRYLLRLSRKSLGFQISIDE